MELNSISSKIISAAIEVHRKLGPGLLESTYEACLVHELQRRKIQVQSQVELPVVYDDLRLNIGYRVDLLVENAVIVELKSVERVSNVHEAQILSYLKLSGYRLGLLINFNVRWLKDGVRRFIN